MRQILIPAALWFFLSSCTAFAGEGLFSRAYTVETVPGGHFELEQTVRDRYQRAFGHYNAIDSRSEFEYGVTDNLQAAFYVNSLYTDAQNAPDDTDPMGDQAKDGSGQHGFTRSEFTLQSFSTEIIYRALSPVTDAVGLAFYFEPEWDFHDVHNGAREYDSLENEFRVLVQKNLFDDQFILVYNLVVEAEYFRYANGHDATNAANLWQGELDVNNELGATYRFAPNWYGGLEIRNHNEVGGFWSHDHSLYWAGPAFHYGGEKFWATAGVLAEVYGGPSGDDAAGSYQGPENLFLHSHEQFETTFKVGIPF